MNKVLVFDFGSQYARLIARRIRELGVFTTVILPSDPNWKKSVKNHDAVILSGGPESVSNKRQTFFVKNALAEGKPVFGMCYGMQLVHQQLGGQTKTLPHGEFGRGKITLLEKDPLLEGVPQNTTVWLSHKDSVVKLAKGFTPLATTKQGVALAVNRKQKIYTAQFHPEVTHTEHGKHILSNFLFVVCRLKPTWQVQDILKKKVLSLRQQTKNRRVIVALSGGVDSTVVAFLLNKAIGKKMVPVFVNTGLLRLNEAEQVQKMFARNLASPLVVVNAQETFLNSLKGVLEPETKRKRVGQAFLQVFKGVAARFSDVPFLAQGTIYPDVIESGGDKNNKAHVIKSHHNVGGLPESQFTVLEPLRNLFKDEVRRLGRLLGVPEGCINQHPFPGPGLSVRIIGEVTRAKLGVLRRVDQILVSSLKTFGLYNKVSQAAAILTPVKTVGVQGDQRTYNNLVALRVVQTSDFMTATFANLKHDFLASVATRIVNEVPHVNRVVYDITSKPPGTIEWE